MAAVLVDPIAETSARTALARLRHDFGTPASRQLSWKADIKKHNPRALRASQVLAEIDGLKVVYVVVDKARLAAGTYGDDVTLFYNVTAYAVLQRILWAADRWPGGRRQVSIRFGHVSKHDSTDTLRYFRIRHGKDAKVPFELVSSLNWTAASQYEMSQVADLYGGFLKEAFWPDEFGNVNGAHIVKAWHQIHRSNKCAIHLGLMPRPQSQWAKDMPWFPCQDCRGP